MALCLSFPRHLILLGILGLFLCIGSHVSAQEEEPPPHCEDAESAIDDLLSNPLCQNIDALTGHEAGSFSVGILSVGNEDELTVLDDKSIDNNILNRIIRTLGQIFGTLAVLLYIIAAYFLIAGYGDENRINKGKTIFTYTTVGLVIGFGSYIIVQFVLSMIFSTI